MSALHKLILVHSLDSTYQEFDFTGHAHFSGGNGQGKSTLLRAILFGYSGETESLGNNWQEVLFPRESSALIFQFGEGKKAFTVCALKPEATIEILLVKGIFEKEIFLSSQKIHSRSEIIKAIKKRKLDFVEKIDSSELYRSIIYGQQNGKNSALYKKFTLLKLPHPDLIYQTQQDLLSDDALNITDLKKQIGNILIDEKQQIDLAEIRLVLSNFIKHWKEINSYYQHQNLIPEIDLKSSQLENRKMQIATIGSRLVKAVAQEKKQKSSLKKELKKAKKSLLEIEEKKGKNEADYFSKLESIFLSKSSFVYRISQAKEKQKSYQNIDLRSIKTSAALLPFLVERKIELKQIIDQKPVPKKGKTKTNPRIDLLNLEIRIQEKELENKWIADREKFVLIAFAEQRKKELAAEEKISAFSQRLEVNEAKIVSLKEQEYQVRKEVLSEVGRKGNLARLNQLEEEYYRLCIEEERSKQRLAILRNKQEIESEEVFRQENDAQEKFKAAIQQKENQIEEVKSQIANMRGSFQGWLEKNYPDWEQSIGKICRKEVLLHPYLGPEIERLNELFFGIKLDLDEVDSDISTVHDLQNILSDLEAETEKLSQESFQSEAKWEKKKVNLEKRFRQKIRQEENEIKKLNYEIEQVKIRLRQQKHKQGNKLQKRVQETEQKAISLGYEILKLNAEKQDFQTQIKAIKIELKKEIESIERSLKIKLEKRADIYKKDLEKLNKSVKLSEQKVDSLLEPIDLKSNLTQLRISLFEIEEAIQKANRDYDLLRQFQSDEKEYFSQLEIWESELRLIEDQIIDLKKSKVIDQEISQRTETELQNAIGEIKTELEKIEQSENRYKVYQKTGFFQTYESLFTIEIVENDESVDELCNQIQAIEPLLDTTLLELKKLIHQFTMELNEGNILGFPTKFSDENAYFQFANKLNHFVETGEINKSESELAVRYAGLINDINLSVRQISSLEAKLKNGVGELREWIDLFGYSGSLKSLQLKAAISDSPLVNIFKKINDFATQHPNQLGEGNLFNQMGNQSKNQEALELLKRLLEHLETLSAAKLPTEMLFELDIILETQQENIKIEQYKASGLSGGAKRLVNCIMRIGLMRLIFEKSEDFTGTHLQALLDNVNELDSTQLAAMIAWMKKLKIDLVSASVDTPSLMDINYGYRLTRNAEAKIKSYQIFSKVG